MAAGDISDTMVTNVRQRLGEWATSGLLTAEIFTALNQGQLDIANSLPDGALDDLTNLATGNLTASRVAKPSDILRMRLVLIAGVKAKRRNVSEFPITGASAANVHYSIWYGTGTELTVSAAGTGACDGTYGVVGLKNGKLLYKHSTADYWIWYTLAGVWHLIDAPEFNGHTVYYHSTDADVLGTWLVDVGSPAPTVVRSSAAVYVIVDLGDAASTAAYELWYIREPTTITTSIDPDFGSTNRGLVEDFAVVECLRLRQRGAEADRVEAAYHTRLRIISSRYTGEKPYEGEPGDPK